MQIKKLEGRDHYVVSVVMLQVGTFDGSNGPVTYLANELEESAELWNGKPLVVYHPVMYGQSVGAGDPDVMNRQKIGTVFNTKFENGKLKAEAWIDADRAWQVDIRVMQAIQNGKKLEVSTGLFMDYEQRNGSMIARNYRPDHLAVLPDKVGACSLKDGCGLLRNEYQVIPCDEEPLEVPTMNFT